MNDSCISHISMGSNDYERSKSFYNQVLPVLGINVVVEHPGAIAYGRKFPEFWVQTPLNGQPASVGNGFHVGFIADSPEQVNLFYQAALAAGATASGEPGPRPHYGEAYYGCFVIDPDGHKIEATYWDMEIIKQQYFPDENS